MSVESSITNHVVNYIGPHFHEYMPGQIWLDSTGDGRYKFKITSYFWIYKVYIVAEKYYSWHDTGVRLTKQQYNQIKKNTQNCAKQQRLEKIKKLAGNIIQPSKEHELLVKHGYIKEPVEPEPQHNSYAEKVDYELKKKYNSTKKAIKKKPGKKKC